MKIKMFTIPNLLTLCNLVCGTLALLFALEGKPLSVSFFLIVAAALFDFTDGAAARLLGQYSKLGVQLDSLADMVSFGAAPSAAALVMYRNAGSCCGAPDALGYAVIIIAAFSALRLAKFNVDPDQSDEFTGLPTPACALFFAGLGYASAKSGIVPQRETLLALSIVMAVLLICPVRMFSLKFHNLSWRDNALRYCFIAVSAALLAAFGPGAVPAVIALYIAVSTVRFAAMRCKNRARQ